MRQQRPWWFGPGVQWRPDGQCIQVGRKERHLDGGLLPLLVGRRLGVHNVTSRPRPGQPGAYRYVIDVEGDAGAEPLASALTDLAALNDAVQVLGSYPGATP